MDFIMHERFLPIGKEGQALLQTKTVAITGLGGVGSVVAEILARAGVKLRIIERGRILESDLLNLSIFQDEDVKKFKAKQAKKRLELINKDLDIKTFHEEITESNLFLLKSDVIVETTNNTNTRLLINKYAIDNKIPLVTHENSGDRGIVLVVDQVQEKNSPCVMCLHTKITMPTQLEDGSYSPVSRFVGALVANEVIKNLLGLGNENKLLKINLLKTDLRHIAVERSPTCSHCSKK